MNIAYLILAHKNLPQLVRLVRTLAADGVDFYIHLDKKIAEATVRAVMAELSRYASVTAVNDRVDISWGGYSIVKATVTGLQAIVSSGQPHDYVILLSGQDYPLKSTPSIMAHFAGNKGLEFMSYCELSPTGWAEAMKRYERYWLLDIIRTRYLRVIPQLALLCLPFRRKMPNGYQAYAGSAWWALTLDCVKYILAFMENNTHFEQFFRLTLCPDEIYFQTIVMNSPFKEKVTNNDLRYIDWSARGTSPKTLTVSDLAGLQAADKLFARKFDSSLDAKILDLLDEAIRQ